MSGRRRVSSNDVNSEDAEQFREAVREEEKLEWQHELDAALAQLDTRLESRRRRVTDDDLQPTLPEFDRPEITGEMLDEIARKVADHMRRSHVVPMPGVAEPVAAARPHRPAGPPRQAAPPPPPEPQLRPGKILAIRFRWPLFRFRLFGRRKRLHPLSTPDIRSTW